ncbi:MAG: sulfatase-like hydrolase/transferase [Candidatus Latescibacteria bacterium]|nr:sulfatase-like hydrolase/transferase [Candidatus Latescibacterota bacterium]
MSRPNLLFIMADQHRFDYLGAAGADFVRTPHLDRLAERGVRFDHCYTNAPICAPARVALATGLQAHRFGGVGNNVFLPRSRSTYYQRLRDAGYRVGCAGKLDLAKPEGDNSDGARPHCFSWGFTHPVEIEGKMHAGQRLGAPFGPYTAHLQERGQLQAFRDDYARRKQDWALSAWDSVLETDDFADAYIGQRSAAWIDEIPDDYPWHLFVSFVGPHDPFDPPTEYAERYREAAMPAAVPVDLEGKPAYLHGRQTGATPEQIETCRRQYCAAIELIDDQVGQILASLERRGMVDNTWIVFSSDHGEMLGDHGAFTKGLAYDPSWRVPLLVSGPGLEGGQVSDALVELIDINPTLCDLAGLPLQQGLDARSFVPLLQGATTDHRSEVLSSLGHFRAVRDHDWKLIDNIGDCTELYDMHQDPEERRNLAPERADIVAQMRQRLNSRWLEGGADW